MVAANCGETATAGAGREFSGTSQASPHVAGMAALVRQRFPNYTPAQVVSYLKENAEQRISSPDPNNAWGHGFTVLPPVTQTPMPTPTVPGAASITSVTPGTSSLSVAWRSPVQTDGAAITAYDLRHIRSDAPSKADGNWRVLRRVWTGTGSLTHELHNLTGGVQYDVQVRAVNSAGEGAWSATASGTVTAAATAPGAPRNLIATGNGPARIDLSWSTPLNDGGAAVTGYRIESSTDRFAWSSVLANSGSTISAYSHSGLTTGGTRYYRVSAINSVGTGPASSIAQASTGAAPAPDLVVDRPTVSTSAPAAGERFTLSATVRNQGNGTSSFTTLRYYQSTDSTITTGDTGVGTDSVLRLDASESGDEWVSLIAPANPGTYYYGACVDSVTDESDTANNCSSAVIVTVGAAPAPDLVVDTPTVSESAPEAAASFTLDATVRNQGNGRSDSTTLRYYQSIDASINAVDTELGTDSVSPLDASESEDESVSLTTPSTAGTYYYGACVDAVSDESDRTNNCSSAVAVTVGAPPAGDSDSPRGIWSDGMTMWVADSGDDKLYAYDGIVIETRVPAKDFDTLNAAGNSNPGGIWSDGTTMWVADSNDEKLYAYDMATKARALGRDFDTLNAAGNSDPRGIWSDGTTMWVADSGDDKLYTYDMATKARVPGKDFDTLNASGNKGPQGI